MGIEEGRGFAVVDGDGVIDVYSVSPSRRVTMVNWLMSAARSHVTESWTDAMVEQIFARYGDDIGVIEVRVVPLNEDERGD